MENLKHITEKFGDAIIKMSTPDKNLTEIHCTKKRFHEIFSWLLKENDWHFCGLTVEELQKQWLLSYLSLHKKLGYLELSIESPITDNCFKTITDITHAADWHEREAEDLFGLKFEGHPLLGDFILHDDAWQENIAPMKKNFNEADALRNRAPRKNWKPRQILKAPGAFIMPIGPVFSGEAESVQFQLETVAEEIISASPRLFFKYRAIEKTAENKTVDEVLLLSERFAGTTAFAHAFAFCLAVEKISSSHIPKKAQLLRIFLAEMERIRHHLTVIREICSSTALVVSANQIGILEEEMLRLCCSVCGHRYMFGLVIPGGLSKNIDINLCKQAAEKIEDITGKANEIEKMLVNTSSFLDRLEEVGILTREQAEDYEIQGPMARASGYSNDLRNLAPYSLYDTLCFEIPCESEGDGYARLRIFFAEIRQSLRIIKQLIEQMPRDGEVFTPLTIKPGIGFAGVETPRGATWHRIRINEAQKTERYHIITPSFINWHGFHICVENFAFQDFPIILSTLGLSVAENDR